MSKFIIFHIADLIYFYFMFSFPAPFSHKKIAVDMMLTKDFSIVKVLRWTLYDFRELSSLVKHFLPFYISALPATQTLLINYYILIPKPNLP